MKFNNPEISVILPFYDAETTLQRALESILHQDYINFECILVNNNSRDKSSKIASEICEKDERFDLINERKQGVVFASNAGSEIARGNYICRMDADDELTEHSLSIRKKFLIKNPDVDVVSGMVNYIPHHSNTQGFQRYVKWSNSIRTYNEILVNRWAESPIVNPSAMWRKEIPEKYGMYRKGNFPEDYELWLRWLEAGVKIQKLQKYVLNWYDSDGRLTRTHPDYSENSFFKIKARYLAPWLKKNVEKSRSVLVWGASRRSRRWSRHLSREGTRIGGYIDIHERRRINKDEIIYYEDIPAPKYAFILVFIRHHVQKREIGTFLNSRGYEEGVDFYYAG
jgi:glycosyltransferase involved in cell wall biosynthesis